jgi:putative sterol carrier protein
MTKFLSEQWVDALIAALNASGDVRDSLQHVDLSVQQVVTGGPEGEVRYWTTFKSGAIAGGIGDVPSGADVTITQDYETAAALSRGELNAQGAFMQGKLKITGNMGKLLQHQAALEALGPVMSTIPTEF